MRVALVHEFLVQRGGAERVLQSLHELFPQAPIFTLVHDPLKTEGFFSKWDVRTSFLRKFPRGVSNYKWYLPLMPKAIESFDFKGYDLVISDSSAFAKGIITHKPSVHISYCHTPTRYLWQEMDDYVANLDYSPVVKWVAGQYLPRLKKWDYRAARRPDYFIANSQTVRERIKNYYDRDSEVIYPPVDTGFFTPTSHQPPPKSYYLTGSRLVQYKRIDLVIEAFNRLDTPLIVAGDGPELENLKRKAKNPKIKFLGDVSDEKLRQLYQGAKAFIFPSVEDAGIMVLESLACGTPVIGLNAGGTAEFIRDGIEGALFKNQSVAEIIEVVRRFDTLQFDKAILRQRALDFDRKIFKGKIRDFVRGIID
ncbi:MAG: glycosyltransferase [Candidatus Doudnabacteria bacterium]|nr:glycosyltransferase [bacterium]MDZ4244218.1 glycosyltransferase [Candidatus Doudnabacteria bacterium]